MKLLYIFLGFVCFALCGFVGLTVVWGEPNIEVSVPDSTQDSTKVQTAPAVKVVETKKELFPLLLLVSSSEDTTAANLKKQNLAQVFAPFKHAPGYCPCKKKK